MTTDALESTASAIEEAARRAGADEAECVVRRTRSLRIEVKDGRPEGVRRTEEVAAALRVLLDGRREGFAFTTAPEPVSYDTLARDAVEAARLLPPVPENRFSDAGTLEPVKGLLDERGLEIPFASKVGIAREMEEAVLGADGRIEQAHKPAYQEQLRGTAIASGGRVWSYEDSAFSLSVQAVARQGEESQSGYDYMASRRLEDLPPSRIGSAAAAEAVALLGGQTPPTGTYPAVFPPKVALDLLGALVSSFSAEEMQKGRSRLAGKRGEELFSRALTIIDDGTMPWKVGSAPFDDERVPPVPRKLVDNGVLEGCLHTLKTAARWSEEPTGNASRGALSGAPVPGPSNLYIQGGRAPVREILPAGTAVRLDSLMGAHMMDRVSGAFSLGASGAILEDGETVRPFRNGTVSGNLFDLMASLTATGDDLAFYGSLGSPTLVFPAVIISGS